MVTPDLKWMDLVVGEPARLTQLLASLKLLQPGWGMRSHASWQSLQKLADDERNLTSWMIFLDGPSDALATLEALDWIKRHPVFHFSPVVILGPESAVPFGFFATLDVPYSTDQLQPILAKYLEQDVGSGERRDFEKRFAKELLDFLQNLPALSPPTGDAALGDLRRHLHNLKGTAAVLQFPHVNRHLHQTESELEKIRALGADGSPAMRDWLGGLAAYLNSVAESIGQRRVLPLAPGSAWVAPSSTIPNGSSAGEKLTQSGPSDPVDEAHWQSLTSRAQRFLQIKNQISSVVRQLVQEFPDEKFPQDLRKWVEELGTEGVDLLEWSQCAQRVTLDGFRRFCEHAVESVSDSLRKPLVVKITAAEGLRIHPAMETTLRTILNHLIRNAADHGVENSAARRAAGKDAIGALRLILLEEAGHKLHCVFEDDGRGIDLPRVRKMLEAQGVMSPAAIQELSDVKLAQFIFLDGLSTTDQITAISGRGVGLASVKAEVDKLGGQITVSSCPGLGTRLEFTLSLRHEAERAEKGLKKCAS